MPFFPCSWACYVDSGVLGVAWSCEPNRRSASLPLATVFLSLALRCCGKLWHARANARGGSFVYGVPVCFVLACLFDGEFCHGRAFPLLRWLCMCMIASVPRAPCVRTHPPSRCRRAGRVPTGRIHHFETSSEILSLLATHLAMGVFSRSVRDARLVAEPAACWYVSSGAGACQNGQEDYDSRGPSWVKQGCTLEA